MKAISVYLPVKLVIVIALSNSPRCTLEELIVNQKVFAENMVYKWMSNLTSVIYYLHTLGIAHRDIKPQNVMITNEGDLKLIDFGIAANFKRKNEERTTSETETDYKFYAKFFTQIMSPLYAAPEILSSDCYDESVDIWGIGIIFTVLNHFLEGGANGNMKALTDFLDTKNILKSSLFNEDKLILSNNQNQSFAVKSYEKFKNGLQTPLVEGSSD